MLSWDGNGGYAVLGRWGKPESDHEGIWASGLWSCVLGLGIRLHLKGSGGIEAMVALGTS